MARGGVGSAPDAMRKDQGGIEHSELQDEAQQEA